MYVNLPGILPTPTPGNDPGVLRIRFPKMTGSPKSTPPREFLKRSTPPEGARMPPANPHSVNTCAPACLGAGYAPRGARAEQRLRSHPRRELPPPSATPHATCRTSLARTDRNPVYRGEEPNQAKRSTAALASAAGQEASLAVDAKGQVSKRFSVQIPYKAKGPPKRRPKSLF